MVTIVAGLGLAIALTLEMKRVPPTPKYDGRTAREWLDQVSTTNQVAAFTAFRMMSTNALPVLVQSLNDTQWNRFYGPIYSNMPFAIQKHMSRPRSVTTWRAAETMLMINPDAYRAFRELAPRLADPRNRARRYIINALQFRDGQQYDSFIPIFVGCLKDSDPVIRAGAVLVLNRIDPEYKVTSVSLSAALRDPSNGMGLQAGLALWQPDGKTSFKAEKETLAVEILTNKSLAIIYLSSVAPDYRGMIPKLVSVLKNDEEHRTSAAVALERYDPAAREAIPVLLELLAQQRGNETARQDFFNALENIDSKAAHAFEQDHPAH